MKAPKGHVQQNNQIGPSHLNCEISKRGYPIDPPFSILPEHTYENVETQIWVLITYEEVKIFTSIFRWEKTTEIDNIEWYCWRLWWIIWQKMFVVIGIIYAPQKLRNILNFYSKLDLSKQEDRLLINKISTSSKNNIEEYLKLFKENLLLLA